MSAMQTDAAFAGLQTAEALTPSQIEERARALRDQLSLDEKLGLMDGDTALLAGACRDDAGGRLWPAARGWRVRCRGWAFPACASSTDRAASS